MSRNFALNAIAALLAATGTAQAETCATAGASQFGQITYCASSALPPQGGRSYGPLNGSGDRETAWVEGVPGNGIGQWLMIRFDSPQRFRTVSINNGYGRSARSYAGNNRVRAARLTTSDGLVLDVTLLDQFEEQKIRLPRPANARWIRLTIRSVYLGSRWRDTAIGGFWVDLEELNYR